MVKTQLRVQLRSVVAARRQTLRNYKTNPRTPHKEKGDQMDDQKSFGTSGQSATARLGSAAAAAKDKVSDVASDTREQLTEISRKATEKFQGATDYVRNTGFSAMVEDVTGVVKRYPVPTLAAAVVVGFLLATAMHRRD
jgi:hypothetical protein